MLLNKAICNVAWIEVPWLTSFFDLALPVQGSRFDWLARQLYNGSGSGVRSVTHARRNCTGVECGPYTRLLRGPYITPQVDWPFYTDLSGGWANGPTRYYIECWMVTNFGTYACLTVVIFKLHCNNADEKANTIYGCVIKFFNTSFAISLQSCANTLPSKTRSFPTKTHPGRLDK